MECSHQYVSFDDKNNRGKRWTLGSSHHKDYLSMGAAKHRLEIDVEISAGPDRLSWKSASIPIKPPADCNNSTNLGLNRTMD